MTDIAKDLSERLLMLAVLLCLASALYLAAVCYSVKISFGAAH